MPDIVAVVVAGTILVLLRASRIGTRRLAHAIEKLGVPLSKADQ